MGARFTILVLGAYGLAGRVIVARLLAVSPFELVASGRRPARLREEFGDRRDARLELVALDATGRGAPAPRR